VSANPDQSYDGTTPVYDLLGGNRPARQPTVDDLWASFISHDTGFAEVDIGII
jgi:hypothetical protein